MSAPIPNNAPGNDTGRNVNPPAAARFQLWLASPQGLRHFDPAILAAADRRRFDTMRSPQRRKEFSLSRALLAHVAVPAASALSLSHSGDHAALASGPAGCTVGVDVEQHRARDVASIAQFAFSEEESSALLTLASPEREQLFYLLWVMKEALAKALQLPLLEALRSCAFSRQGGDWAAAVPTRRRWAVLAFEPRPKTSLAIACVANEDRADLGFETGIETLEWPSHPSTQRRPACWPRLAMITPTK